ncbi:MAG TPA: deoxyribodipyrimidine photo-lyase [Gaiella sp.]|jgi:deoxyribodipyrimidine photo-lyase
MPATVVLFTRDLRVHDQPTLRAATDAGGEVVPLFVLDDAFASERVGVSRRAFLAEALADLRESLRVRGGDLVVRRGDPVVETLRIAHAVGAATISVGDDASAYAQRRRRRLAEACAGERIELRVEDTIAAVPAGELAPDGRDHYRRFTPYWRRWRETPLPAVLGPPKRVVIPHGLDPGALPPKDERAGLPPGGEAAGRRRLAGWLRDGIRDYAATRDLLAVDGTSRLSPYLHFGCVSAREAVERARGCGPVAEEFVRQLCWRDFFLQLLEANPGTQTADLRSRAVEWREDEEALERWSQGLTGVPIVDAGMRQLRREGWLHNRGRLIVGSFLTRTLGLDWRRGAEVFFDLLVDGDVANNVGNWQWVAGTGADSRPNRRFNPLRQANRFDPDGAYVRRYVPELADVDPAFAHEPWRAPRSRRPAAYPPPLGLVVS